MHFFESEILVFPHCGMHDSKKATNGNGSGGNIVEKFKVHISQTDSQQNYNNVIAIEKDIDFSFELFNALWNILRYHDFYQIPIHEMCFCFKENSIEEADSGVNKR